MNTDPVAIDGPAVGLDPGIPRLARIAVLALGVLAILAWLLLALAHVHDRFNVNAVSGTLLALADRARDGVLYPPLFDGQSYAGTRTMPLPILLYAGAISLGGELIAPAKVVDFLSSVALVLVIVAILRRSGASVALSLALASTVVTSQVFLLAATGIRPESLPTALQLAAVALVAFVPRRAAIVLAGVLCAVAIFCKVSALWAPITIVVWLLLRERRGLPSFAATLAISIVALFAAFNVASDGRMLTNLVELGGAGISVIGVLKAPLKGVELLLQYAQASFVLLPVLLVGVLLAGRRARPTMFQVGLVAAAGILLTVMADVGSDYNHLLDVVVLLPIVTYEVVRDLARRMTEPGPLWSFMAASILVGSSAALAVNAGSSLATAVGLPGATEQSAYDPQPLAVELAGTRSVLSEDPYVHLARGERPIVLDPFMFIRIARQDPGLVEPLLTSLDDQRFEALVLTRDLRHPEAAAWFRDYAFGLPVYESMRDNYRLCSVTEGYFLFYANSLPCPGPRG